MTVRPTLQQVAFAALLILISVVLAVSAGAQERGDARLPQATARVELAGPRFGVTYLSTGVQDKLAERDIEVGAMVSQFGWQFERQFLGVGESISPITEVVVLVGGLDQGAFLPSVSWLVGLRTHLGTEIGVGPNVTPAGVALAIAGGVTVRQRTLNIPINLAVVPSKSGARVSMLTGFTMR